ncbi:MAG: hypothetical protein COB02_15100 [Candidatus Cloacimonadota bacterium]|nr:MAG: hypothetical protein COB02_15100 [Candidatus Cloacimonadota bacterium]
MKNIKERIENIELRACKSLKQQVWMGSSDLLSYFSDTPQGLRYDDGLYQLLLRFISKEVKTILDVGAGEGKLAESLNNHGYQTICLEPSQNRSIVINNKLIPNIKKFFCDFESKINYDCVISLRSIGVISKIKEDYFLHKTIEKLLGLSTIQLIIVSKAIEDSSLVQKKYRVLSSFTKEPWLYHLEILKLMDKNPNLSFVSLSVNKAYKSMQDCIEKDFKADSIDLVNDYLSSCGFKKDKLFYRKVNLLFPVVNVVRGI